MIEEYFIKYGVWLLGPHLFLILTFGFGIPLLIVSVLKLIKCLENVN